MIFNFGDQVTYGIISILQDAFKKLPVDPKDFTDDKVPQETFKEFYWNNDRNAKKSLIITENEPFEETRYPAIFVTINSGDLQNLDFGQYLDDIIEGGKKVGEIIGGAGEFSASIRCACESTGQRKKLADVTMAMLTINREEFEKRFSQPIYLRNYRFGSYGNQSYLEGDRKIYYQDITLKFWGEWCFEVRKKYTKLGAFHQIINLACRPVSTGLTLTYNNNGAGNVP